MSRAFTKEIDDAPIAPRPERPISSAPNLVTPRGAALIEEEIQRLERGIKAAPNASEIEDLRREERYWRNRRSSMQVIEPGEQTSVGFGQTFRIKRRGKEIELQVVGEDEADPNAGKIAWTSPLAMALKGSEPGDVVEFGGGASPEKLEVLSMGSGSVAER